LNVTLQASVGTAGQPEITSAPWTANAGDCVLVTWAIQSGGGAPQLMTLTTAGYTWNYTPTLMSADNDITMQGAWALNVPAGTEQFSTSGLGFSGVTYFVFTISGVAAQDQLGTQLFPPGGNDTILTAEITTQGPLAQTGEAAIAWWQCQFVPVTITPMPGWTTTPLQTNPVVSVINALAAWNANVGTAGQPLTGGWSVIANAGPNGMTAQAILLTFRGPSGGAGAQPGFPKSARIEEPSEGMQESNVTPPDMGTEQ
jgi:hypothetical protein